MNILFIDPPSFKGTLSHDEKTKLPSPNIGIIYIATYLKEKINANVLILDMVHDNIGFMDLPKIIKEFSPSVVGISAKTFNILSAYKLSNIIKKVSRKIVIILGGAHGTALPEYTLGECSDIDAIVLREGEETVLDLCTRIGDSYDLTDDIFVDVPGIVYRNKYGQVIKNNERELIADLDTLPFPDLSFVNYTKYKRNYNPNKHRFQHVYSVFGSRGCPFNCTFCMPLHTRKHRVRSIENILDEIEMLNIKHGAERIYFDDSLFCVRKKWFLDFCEKYAGRGLNKKVQWGFETRIDIANTEMFRHAKECGCIYTVFGVESGNEMVLKKANKRYSRDSIIEKVTSAKSAGIDEVCINIILGLPYETKETIRDTLTLMEELPYDYASISLLHLLPGTAAFEMADKGEGGLRWIEGKRMNWSAYSEDEPMAKVNDVNSAFLFSSREKGLRISARKAKNNKVGIALKRLAYTIEFARTDRRRLLQKIKDTIRGIK